MLQAINAYICGIITTIEVVIFGKIVLDEEIKISKKQLFIIGIITSLLYATSYLILKDTIKTFSMFLVDVFFYVYMFKISNQKAIFLTFIYMIVLLIPNFIELFFVTKILGLSKEIFYNDYAGTIIANFSITLLFILITYLMKNIIRKLINTKVENNIKILIFSILIFICIGMFFYTFANEYRIGHNFILYLVAMIVLVSVLFSLIKQTIENNKLTKEYDKLLEFMITYEKEIEKQRTLRHETKNEFLAIKGKIHDKQKNKEIIAYIDEILKDKIEVKQEEYAKFGFLPANGIKGLCYLKAQEAQDKGIKTSINISKRVENSNIYKLNIKEQRDLGKILGVFLDNAIEASLTSNDKKFSIEVYLNLEKECQIIISNSFEEEINLDKMGNERFSTKGKTRGHGLLLVKHIVSNNHKFSTNTKITGNLYTQTVTIKNSNSN
jgi:two-component system sensor histidine kinase AgrC